MRFFFKEKNKKELLNNGLGGLGGMCVVREDAGQQ